jgi:hypothetical protein
MLIEDGVGSGRRAKVNVDNMLHVYSVTNPRFADAASRFSLAFSWSNISYDYDAGDTILLVKNEDPDRLLRIGPLYASSDAITEMIVHSPACTTPTGTAVTGTNLDRRSSNIAKATAIADETTNTQANVVMRCRLFADFTFGFDFAGALVLGEDQCIAIDFADAGTSASVTIIGYYQDNNLDY